MMLLILGAVAVLEAAAILTSSGLCVFKQSMKLKRRDGKRFKGDAVYGNGFPGRKGTGGGAAAVIFASGVDTGADGYRRNDAVAGGDDYGGGDDGGDEGGTDGGDDGGGDGGGCGGGGCGGDD